MQMTISAKRNSDPSNRKKVIQATKEKGIKEILANTTVDKINNKVSVKYLYEEEKLPQLGENLYGATSVKYKFLTLYFLSACSVYHLKHHILAVLQPSFASQPRPELIKLKSVEHFNPPCIHERISLLSVVSCWMDPSYSTKSSLNIV